MTWISVKERLPIFNENILIFERGRSEPFIGWYNIYWFISTKYLEIEGDAYFGNNINQDEVTHWMPLPKGPEGGE